MRKQGGKSKIDRLQKMSQIAGTRVFFFSEREVNIQQKKIRGIYFNEGTKKWSVRFFPFPDVYYNRRGECKSNKKVQRLRKLLDKMRVPKVNSEHYFHKWKSYQLLRKYEELRSHLPETIYFEDKSDLETMFRSNNRLYLKSFRQDNGVGVMCVTKDDDNYECKYFKNEEFIVEHVPSIEQVLVVMESFFRGKGIIVQSPINLLKYNNRSLDLRCDVQRNGKGELEYTAHSVRVGAENSHITNTRSNPEIYRFEPFFIEKLEYSKKEVDRLKAQIEELLKNVYHRMEEIYGAYGEIGVDIGVDRFGSIWVIECNTKPGKNSLWVYDDDTIDRAFLNPLLYAKYLLSNEGHSNQLSLT
ncbi:YheC/YheD family protein [Halobacillus trueperi]|uniref:YheC/YheD family endospore coat-associated protein n=1 Tax=Halobacillus trueperi TaxID=156205 RepID=UPI0037350472